MDHKTVRVLLELSGVASRHYARSLMRLMPEAWTVSALVAIKTHVQLQVWRSERRRPTGRLRSVARKEVRPVQECSDPQTAERTRTGNSPRKLWFPSQASGW